MRKAVSAAEKQAAPVASSQQAEAEPITTEAPEDVHLRKRIKLQKGWLYQPSPDGVDENLLILLHGYGDTPGDLSASHSLHSAAELCSKHDLHMVMQSGAHSLGSWGTMKVLVAEVLRPHVQCIHNWCTSALDLSIAGRHSLWKGRGFAALMYCREPHFTGLCGCQGVQ